MAFFSGLPQLPHFPSPANSVQFSLGVIQGAIWRAFQIDTRWGVFDDQGNSLFDTFDSIFGPVLSISGVDYYKEVQASEFPVERGGFAQYNKVETPGRHLVAVALTGDENARKELLQTVDRACKATDLWIVALPEGSYPEASLVNYNYRRQATKGANMLIVELEFVEVRQVVTSYGKTAINKPQALTATPAKDAGNVQPTPARESIARQIFN